MIPDHYIDKAAQAILGSTGSTGRLEDLHPEDAAYMRADARAALEAVAADIWDEGFTRGVNAYDIDASLHETREIDLNPYRASETASEQKNF